ncbi:zinc finger protein 28 [Biomphalaria glabrata]|nr:zinc finger protein 28 [Biomphalaria glabrata]
MEQNVNECRNVIKIEKIDWSDTSENSFASETYELTLNEEAQASEEQNHSRSVMDDMEQDLTNDLKNVIKIEKTESSLDSETQEISSVHTIKEEETQKKMVTQNQEMTLNQDLYARNTPHKDENDVNSEDEEQNFSYSNRSQRKKKSDRAHIEMKINTPQSKLPADQWHIKVGRVYTQKHHYTSVICIQNNHTNINQKKLTKSALFNQYHMFHHWENCLNLNSVCNIVSCS